jgi:hypothetical protein
MAFIGAGHGFKKDALYFISVPDRVISLHYWDEVDLLLHFPFIVPD